LNNQQIEKGDVISILTDSFPGNFPSIKIIPITQAEIRSTIHSHTKSSGYDEITRKILRACASLISHPVSYSYNLSVYTVIFPDCLKIAVVKPLYNRETK